VTQSDQPTLRSACRPLQLSLLDEVEPGPLWTDSQQVPASLERWLGRMQIRSGAEEHSVIRGRADRTTRPVSLVAQRIGPR
jgi:hypothetical protein